MTKTRKLGLMVAAALLLAFSLAGSASAQTIDGGWSGYEYFTTSVYQNGFPVYTYSGSSLSNFGIYNFPGNSSEFEMYISGDFAGVSAVSAFGPLSPPDAFGPASATGSVLGFPDPSGFGFGNFDLTYQSILPDGDINVGDGIAIADITALYYSFDPNFFYGDEIITFASFTSVPEPQSIVPAALAILVIAVVVGIRRVRWRTVSQRGALVWLLVVPSGRRRDA